MALVDIGELSFVCQGQKRRHSRGTDVLREFDMNDDGANIKVVWHPGHLAREHRSERRQ